MTRISHPRRGRRPVVREFTLTRRTERADLGRHHYRSAVEDGPTRAEKTAHHVLAHIRAIEG